METSQILIDPYGNDYLSLEYEVDHLKLDEVQIDITIYYTNGLSQVLNGFRINNSNRDYLLYHFYRPLIKNRLYFHKKLLGDGNIAFILASVNYPKKYKALNYSVCNYIDESYKLFDIILLTKKINTDTVKFLDGQWFDKDLYPELYSYLGKDTLPNIPPKTFIKFNGTSNKLAVNKTKFYRIFWGHTEAHDHTATLTGANSHDGNGHTSHGSSGDSRQRTSTHVQDHNINFNYMHSEGLFNNNTDHWDFNTGDACSQRIPLYYHMKIKDTGKLKDIFINPFDDEHIKQELIEYQIVEASGNANFAIVILDNIPYPNRDILLTIDGIDITVLNDTFGYAEYPKESEAVYFQDDKNFGVIYVHPKHIGKKIKIHYNAITKNLIRDNELLLDVFEVGEPFPLLHRMDNDPNFMLCNGSRFNKDIYKKLYAKLGTDILPDYCAGFIASEIDNNKIQKIQKYEYPQIGYMGYSSHQHSHPIFPGNGADGGWKGIYGSRNRASARRTSTYGVESLDYTSSIKKYPFNISFDTNLSNYEFSNELAPTFSGLYWYIRAI